MTVRKPETELDLAATLARAAQRNLRAQGASEEEIAAFALPKVRAQLGAAGKRPASAKPRVGGKARRAIERRHGCKLAGAGEPTTPADVPRPRPRPTFAPMKPWEARRSRQRLVAALARTGAPRFDPLDWTDRAWAVVESAFRTPSRTPVLVAELPRCAAARARLAILVEQRQRGDDRDGIDWTHPTARGIAACALVLYRMSKPTKKRGFGRVLVGVSQEMFAALFRNVGRGRVRRPNKRKPWLRRVGGYHINTLFATEVHGNRERGGWVKCLERAGFHFAVQPPAEITPEAFVGPSGYALGQYWLTERTTSAEVPAFVLDALDALGVPEAPYVPASSPRGPP